MTDDAKFKAKVEWLLLMLHQDPRQIGDLLRGMQEAAEQLGLKELVDWMNHRCAGHVDLGPVAR